MISRSAAVLPQTVTLRPTLVATVVEDGAVLLDLDSKYFYALNESAWAVVQLFETTAASVDAVLAQCVRWGANDDAAVRAFLEQLTEERIVEEGGAADALPEVSFKGEWCSPVMRRQAEPLHGCPTRVRHAAWLPPTSRRPTTYWRIRPTAMARCRPGCRAP